MSRSQSTFHSYKCTNVDLSVQASTRRIIGIAIKTMYNTGKQTWNTFRHFRLSNTIQRNMCLMWTAHNSLPDITGYQHFTEITETSSNFSKTCDICRHITKAVAVRLVICSTRLLLIKTTAIRKPSADRHWKHVWQPLRLTANRHHDSSKVKPNHIRNLAALR